MDINEATDWLRGKRSWTNVIPQDPIDTWLVRTSQADAASTQQAYWIAKAHADGLIRPEEKTEFVGVEVIKNQEDADPTRKRGNTTGGQQR